MKLPSSKKQLETKKGKIFSLKDCSLSCYSIPSTSGNNVFIFVDSYSRKFILGRISTSVKIKKPKKNAFIF